jgi:hypothetical protein
MLLTGSTMVAIRHQSASVAATFHEAFPDSMLWIDPDTSTGILVGRKGSRPEP